VLEGWCLGAAPQSLPSLVEAINTLERVTDAGGIWRRYVNEQLAGPYATLFQRLDRMVYLRAPDFSAVRRWRLEQEHKLAERRGSGMSDAEVGRFVEYFERVTRAMLESPRSQADVVADFDAAHACIRLDWLLSAKNEENG
jgi:D-glycerate 3-kinase